MIKHKFIFNIGVFLSLGICSFILYNNINIDNETNISVLTIEDLVKESNFKLNFKNLNELEYTLQDSTTETNTNSSNKTFLKNNKFNIYINNETNKINAISYTSNIADINNNDLDYLQKIYNFVFDNLSSFILDKTNEILEKSQDSDYITSNKNLILDNGYISETITLSKTSEIKITTYYQNHENKLSAYKVSIDILQGNKW